MAKLSPAFNDGTKPREPTSAAAPSLEKRMSRLDSFGDVAATHEIMSPYRLGATVTSKILSTTCQLPGDISDDHQSESTHSGSRKSLQVY